VVGHLRFCPAPARRGVVLVLDHRAGEAAKSEKIPAHPVFPCAAGASQVDDDDASRTPSPRAPVGGAPVSRYASRTRLGSRELGTGRAEQQQRQGSSPA
jgi:hypothetical protein